MDSNPGIKTTEFAAVGASGLATFIPVVLGALPQDQIWIALVAFGVVAVAYIVCRTYIKAKGVE